MSYLKENFLLTNKTAEKLYSDYAENMPIFDYHCHLPEKVILENKPFNDIFEIWLSGDHYKWRLMRNYGVNEDYITGNKSNKEKFKAYCATLGTAFGTRVTDNVIYNVSSRTYGGWGLYADEGSEGIVFARNLVYNTHDGGFHQHYGAGNTVQNNVFAWNEQNGVIRTIRANVFNVRSSLNDYDKTILSVFADAPERPEDVREVYLAPGAVLNARLKIRHPGVRLHGRGKVLDPMSDVFRYDQVQNPSRGLVAIHASGVTVEGVKLVFRDFRLVRP